MLGWSGRAITALIGFNESGPQVAIALLGDAKTVVLAARGLFPDIHPNPGHPLSWVGETLNLSDFGNHAEGKEILNHENGLVSRQFSQVDAAQADFLISYNVVVDQRIRSSNLSGGVAVGRSSRSRHDSIGISTGSQIYTYEQGALYIDVVDVASDKLVWRGVSSQALPDLSDPQRLTDHVNTTVAAILEQFPPGGKPESKGVY